MDGDHVEPHDVDDQVMMAMVMTTTAIMLNQMVMMMTMMMAVMMVTLMLPLMIVYHGKKCQRN